MKKQYTELKGNYDRVAERIAEHRAVKARRQKRAKVTMRSGVCVSVLSIFVW